MNKMKIVRNFISTKKHMVVSTSDKNGNPEAALVGFAVADDLSLVFGTNRKTRKFINIQNNPHTAIVFGSDEGITVQYEGIVSVLIAQELEKYKKIYFEKSPGARKYEEDVDQVYLKVKPKWIRYTNYTVAPAEIFEMNLDTKLI